MAVVVIAGTVSSPTPVGWITVEHRDLVAGLSEPSGLPAFPGGVGADHLVRVRRDVLGPADCPREGSTRRGQAAQSGPSPVPRGRRGYSATSRGPCGSRPRSH